MLDKPLKTADPIFIPSAFALTVQGGAAKEWHSKKDYLLNSDVLSTDSTFCLLGSWLRLSSPGIHWLFTRMTHWQTGAAWLKTLPISHLLRINWTWFSGLSSPSLSHWSPSLEPGLCKFRKNKTKTFDVFFRWKFCCLKPQWLDESCVWTACVSKPSISRMNRLGNV